MKQAGESPAIRGPNRSDTMKTAFVILASVILAVAVGFLFTNQPMLAFVTSIIGCGLCIAEIHHRNSVRW